MLTVNQLSGFGAGGSEPPSIGGHLFDGEGGTNINNGRTFTWTCPQGVTSISAVCISPAMSSYGGTLSYKNNIPVTPLQQYTVRIHEGGASDGTYFSALTIVSARTNPSYSPYGDGGGRGGTSGYGGGGAGGYSGNGGNGGTWSSRNGINGSGGGGGGGGCGQYDYWDGEEQQTGGVGSGGGGVSVYGQGTNGVGATGSNTNNAIVNGGDGGSGGANGYNANSSYGQIGGGGVYGGGSGGGDSGGSFGGGAGRGAVRIVWGPNRAFPSTNVGKDYMGFIEGYN